jgi:azurin
LRALPLLGDANAAASFAILAAQLRTGTQRAIITRSLLQLPRTAWADADAAPLTENILTYARTVPTARRTSQDFVETVQLGNELATRLAPADAIRVRKTLRELGVSVFIVKTVREQMRFDVTQLVVEAGKPFEIILENVDIMPHNLVVVTPGAREEVGLAAMAMPATPDKLGRLYVPENKKVLAATKMLEPGEKERLRVTAPKQPGTYEYVCTFPGHWTVMWGKLIVTDDIDAWQAANPPAAQTAASIPAHKH